MKVGARRGDDADPLQKLGGDPAQLGYADADRVGTGPAQPRKSSCGIGQYEREGTALGARRWKLGDQLEELVDACGDERDRLVG